MRKAPGKRDSVHCQVNNLPKGQVESYTLQSSILFAHVPPSPAPGLANCWVVLKRCWQTLASTCGVVPRQAAGLYIYTFALCKRSSKFSAAFASIICSVTPSCPLLSPVTHWRPLHIRVLNALQRLGVEISGLHATEHGRARFMHLVRTQCTHQPPPSTSCSRFTAAMNANNVRAARAALILELQEHKLTNNTFQ